MRQHAISNPCSDFRRSKNLRLYPVDSLADAVSSSDDLLEMLASFSDMSTDFYFSLEASHRASLKDVQVGHFISFCPNISLCVGCDWVGGSSSMKL